MIRVFSPAWRMTVEDIRAEIDEFIGIAGILAPAVLMVRPHVFNCQSLVSFHYFEDVAL